MDLLASNSEQLGSVTNDKDKANRTLDVASVNCDIGMVKGNPEVWGLNSKAKIAINCHGEDKERFG